jgi:preprotein translocase subunit SecA
MSVVNKEKATFAIQTFMMFLNITKKTQAQFQGEIEVNREQTLALLERLIANQIDPLSAIFQLNRIIDQVNKILRAPYPFFVTDTSENLIKGEIVAFEHYLNQELKAHHLTVQDEAPLFNDSLSLWEKVGVSLSAHEGAKEFAALVEKVNAFLPKEEQYPLPDISQY